MTSDIDRPASRLWTRAGFRDDDWSRAESAAALEGNGRFILPLGEFLGVKSQRRAALRERLGVLLMPGDQLEGIVEHLDDTALVALAFPAYNDGRSYSKAELLRGRHGFTGAVRAVGDVLVDQLPHMLRTGFDEFEITNQVLLRRLEEGRVGGIRQLYQPSAAATEPVAGYSWRRLRTTS